MTTPRVCPSATFSCASAAAESEADAPLRFSTTTGWPDDAETLLASARESRSIAPPAGTGTIKVIGRVGQTGWAFTGQGLKEPANIAAVVRSRLREKDRQRPEGLASCILNSFATGKHLVVNSRKSCYRALALQVMTYSWAAIHDLQWLAAEDFGPTAIRTHRKSRWRYRKCSLQERTLWLTVPRRMNCFGRSRYS